MRAGFAAVILLAPALAAGCFFPSTASDGWCTHRHLFWTEPGLFEGVGGVHRDDEGYGETEPDPSLPFQHPSVDARWDEYSLTRVDWRLRDNLATVLVSLFPGGPETPPSLLVVTDLPPAELRPHYERLVGAFMNLTAPEIGVEFDEMVATEPVRSASGAWQWVANVTANLKIGALYEASGATEAPFEFNKIGGFVARDGDFDGLVRFAFTAPVRSLYVWEPAEGPGDHDWEWGIMVDSGDRVRLDGFEDARRDPYEHANRTFAHWDLPAPTFGDEVSARNPGCEG